MGMSVKVKRLPLIRRAFCLWTESWEAHDMTSLTEAERKFGDVVRSAGGAIFGVENSLLFGSKQGEKLQIGTPDGFVKLAVVLNQPNIDAVLREQTSILVKHAETLRTCSRLIASRSVSNAPTRKL
jgi:hypothetical protein